MGLFQPGWMSRDEQKAMRAFEKVTDDDTLFRITSECPHLSVQIKAAQKIRNADRRLDVALTKRLLNYEVRMAALEGASEEGLSLVARNAASSDIRLEAVRRMKDERCLAEVVKATAGGNRDDLRICEAAYEKMNHPPFECSMRIHNRKTDANLLYDLKGMSYPDDREKLMRIIFEKDGKCAETAVRMLAYEQEREVLRNLAVNGKRNARLAAIEALRLPTDRDIIDAILSDPKSDLALKKYAARLLPDEDPMLDQLCCPFCGSFGSVYHHGGYDGAVDMYYSAYKCRTCGHEVRKHSVIGTADAKDFSVSLRDLCGKPGKE